MCPCVSAWCFFLQLSLPEEEEEEEKNGAIGGKGGVECDLDEPGFSVMLAACAAHHCPHTVASCGVFRV